MCFEVVAIHISRKSVLLLINSSKCLKTIKVFMKRNFLPQFFDCVKKIS